MEGTVPGWSRGAGGTPWLRTQPCCSSCASPRSLLVPRATSALLSPRPWPCRELCPCVMNAARSPVSFGWVPGTSPCSRCLHLVKNSVSSPGYMFPCHCRCPLFQCITRHQYITRFLFPLYTYVWSRLSVKLFPQVRAHPCRLQGALQAGGLISRWGLSPEENQV